MRIKGLKKGEKGRSRTKGWKSYLLVLGIVGILWNGYVSAFTDISIDDPQHHIFMHLKEVGVMGPYADGAFHPERNITRAEALTIALRAGGIAIPEPKGEMHFDDVDLNQWYGPVVARAVELKIVSAKNLKFRPNQLVSKAEFLAFLFRATLVDFRPFFGRTAHLATDVPADSWFAPHFAYAKKYQIAHLPSDNFYRPFKVLSRREAAMMTFRQLRIFHGDEMVKTFMELQAEIQQFITLLRADKSDEAEMKLQKILRLNDELSRTKNNEDALAARAISRAMTHMADGLRYFRRGKVLMGVEYMYLAAKQVVRVQNKSESFRPFAHELLLLIEGTMDNFLSSDDTKVW